MEFCTPKTSSRTLKKPLKCDSNNNNNFNVQKAFERPLMERNKADSIEDDSYLPKRYRISTFESPNENHGNVGAKRLKLAHSPSQLDQLPSLKVAHFWLVNNAEYGGPVLTGQYSGSSSSSGQLPSSSVSLISSRSVSEASKIVSSSSSSGQLPSSSSSSSSTARSPDDDSPPPPQTASPTPEKEPPSRGAHLRTLNSALYNVNQAYRRLFSRLPRPETPPPIETEPPAPPGDDATAQPSPAADSSPLLSEDGGSFPSIETDHSESESWPPRPEIHPVHVDFSPIETIRLPPSFSTVFGSRQPRCQCALPDPDQWNDLGLRACDRDRECVLADLRVECARSRCPCESLCHNCQFQDLDASGEASRLAEMFFDRDGDRWGLRAVADTPKDRLLFSLGGAATLLDSAPRPRPALLLTMEIAVDVTSDPHSLMHHLRQGGPAEANVHIEKWLVPGAPPRVGLFSSRSLDAREELVVHYDEECLVAENEWQSLETLVGLQRLVRSLVHDGASRERLYSLVARLVDPGRPGDAIDGLARLGGLSVLSLMLPPTYMSLLTGHATEGALRPLWGPRGEERADQTAGPLLPPMWARSLAGERPFHWHRVTGRLQWEAPTFPWEGHDQEDRGEDIYDYDEASLVPVTLAEIEEMNQELNRIHEIRLRMEARKEERRRARREAAEAARREAFRRAVMAVIVSVLRPYRGEDCPRGRITCEEDLHYLSHKLTAAVLRKELKMLEGASARLRVNKVVEAKTATYVKAYLDSRGNIYRRKPS